MRGIQRSPVDSPHKGQCGGALRFCLTCAWTNGWANNRNAGDLKRHRTHYDVTVMKPSVCIFCRFSIPIGQRKCIRNTVVFFSIHREPWYWPSYPQLSLVTSVLEGLREAMGSNIYGSSASIPIWLIAHLGLIHLSRLHTRNLVSSLSRFIVLLSLHVMVMITNTFSAIQIYGLPQFITFDCKLYVSNVMQRFWGR